MCRDERVDDDMSEAPRVSGDVESPQRSTLFFQRRKVRADTIIDLKLTLYWQRASSR